MMRRDEPASLQVGRYVLHDELASGGMGTVHLGSLQGGAGFSRIVAIKRLNPLLAKQPEFLRMFLDEARLAGRVRHPNVVPTIDVVEADGEVLLVMEYVHGEALSRLLRLTKERGHLPSAAIASAILTGILYGLHAAHEATDERGEALGIVHRDVSPHNVLVGTDGVSRLVDFGVAKASGRLQTTSEGQIKGKLAYMPPEQIQGQPVDRRADVYAAGVVLWELVTGERLFLGENQADTMRRVLIGDAPPPSRKNGQLSPALDSVVLRALSREPSERFSTARQMSAALLDACPPAPPHVVGEWVEACAHESLAARAAHVSDLETATGSGMRPVQPGQAKRGERVGDLQGSQVSSISVSAEIALARPRRKLSLIVGGVVLGVVALALALFAIHPWQPAHEVVATPLPRPRPPPPPSASVAVGGDPAPAPPSTAASDVGADASSAATLPSPSSAAAPAASPRPAARPRGATPTPAPDCNPPYTRNADGHKVWKLECFGQKH